MGICTTFGAMPTGGGASLSEKAGERGPFWALTGFYELLPTVWRWCCINIVAYIYNLLFVSRTGWEKGCPRGRNEELCLQVERLAVGGRKGSPQESIFDWKDRRPAAGRCCRQRGEPGLRAAGSPRCGGPCWSGCSRSPAAVGSCSHPRCFRAFKPLSW